MSNIFEYATKNKLRFTSDRGQLTVEDLWDMPLRSKNGFDLNAIAKNASKTVKNLSEDNFVDNVRTPGVERSEMALDIIKYVIEVKLTEEANDKKKADNKIEREKLMAILAEKQDGKLSKLTEDEIQKRIAALT